MTPHNIESGTHKTLHYLLLGLQVNLQMTKTFAFVKLISTKSQNLYIYRTCMFEKASQNYWMHTNYGLSKVATKQWNVGKTRKALNTCFFSR